MADEEGDDEGGRKLPSVDHVPSCNEGAVLKRYIFLSVCKSQHINTKQNKLLFSLSHLQLENAIHV